MATELVISGGGSTAVASDELFGHAHALRALADRIGTSVRKLSVIDGLVSARQLAAVEAPMSAGAAEEKIELSRVLLGDSRQRAQEMADRLQRAAENYGEVEGSLARITQALSDRLGYAIGFVLPLAVAAALPMLLVGAPIIAAAIALLRKAQRENGSAGLGHYNGLLSDPVTVALLRAAVGSADDVIGGFLKLPPELVRLLGDEGFGVVGLPTSAGLLQLAGNAGGLLAETDVTVRKTGQKREGQAPLGFSDRADRIPSPGSREDGAQVIVERYDIPGEEPRFEAYIGGTVDFSPIAGTEPWDMTSNISGVAGLPAGSYRAVAEALAASGVTGSSPIIFTGHSQGGLVASLLASSGNYNTQGLVTYGAPAGQVPIPSGFPAVIVEHRDDIIPATGGAQINRNAIVVERSVFAGREIPTTVPIPAHQLTSYRETSVLLDSAQDPKVREAAAALGSFGSGATTITSLSYRAERVG